MDSVDPSPDRLQPIELTKSTEPSGALKLLGRAIAALALLFFLGVCFSHLFADGLCCADDSIFASVARNLASGVGYATTVQMDSPVYQVRLFDPLVGTGPAVILPAAFFTSLLGNRYWVPGFSAILLWLSLLAVLWTFLKSTVRAQSRYLGVVTFFFLSYAIFPYHFEHWFALLGEVPAALFLCLAALLLTTGGDRRGRTFLAGVVFALSVLCKSLSLLWLPAFAVPFLLPALDSRPLARRLRYGCLFLLGAFTPVAAFELVQLGVLGIPGYRQHWTTLRTFSLRWGLAQSSGDGVWQRIAENQARFLARFSISPLLFLILAILALLVIWRRSPPLRGFASIVGAGVAVHFSWWLAFSVGWPRYAIIGVLGGIVLLSAAAAAPMRFLPSIAWLSLLLITCFPAWNQLTYPLATEEWGVFQPNTRTRNATRVVRMIEEMRGDRPVVTQWWAMAAAFDYLSPNRWPFRTAAFRESGAPDQASLVLVDDRFLNRRDSAFQALLDRCGAPIISLPPYRVFSYVPPPGTEGAGP